MVHIFSHHIFSQSKAGHSSWTITEPAVFFFCFFFYKFLYLFHELYIPPGFWPHFSCVTPIMKCHWIGVGGVHLLGSHSYYANSALEQCLHRVRNSRKWIIFHMISFGCILSKWMPTVLFCEYKHCMCWVLWLKSCGP